MATDEFINHWRKKKREREFANEHFEIKSGEAENENEEIIKYRKSYLVKFIISIGFTIKYRYKVLRIV